VAQWLNGFIHFLASSVCHGLPARSLIFSQGTLPFCARCTGVYSGFFLTTLFFSSFGKSQISFPTRSLTFLNLGFIVLMILFGFHLVGDTSPPVRFVVGALFGSALAVFIFPVITNWIGGLSLRRWDKRTIFRYLLFLFFLGGISFLAHFDLAVLFYLFLIGSVLGLILAYLFVNMAVLAWIFRVRGRSGMRPKVAIVFAALIAFGGEIILQRWWHIFWQSR